MTKVRLMKRAKIWHHAHLTHLVIECELVSDRPTRCRLLRQFARPNVYLSARARALIARRRTKRIGLLEVRRMLFGNLRNPRRMLLGFAWLLMNIVARVVQLFAALVAFVYHVCGVWMKVGWTGMEAKDRKIESGKDRVRAKKIDLKRLTWLQLSSAFDLAGLKQMLSVLIENGRIDL